MHRKGAQDKKRAKIFTRLIRELTVAAKAGADPDSNPRLRTAIAAARAANMPKDNIDRVLKKAAGGGEETNYEEIRYEGYGPIKFDLGQTYQISGVNLNCLIHPVELEYSNFQLFHQIFPLP